MLTLILVANLALAGDFTDADRQAVYIEATKLKSADAYSRANAWAAKKFTDSNSAIKLADKGEAHLVIKGSIRSDAISLTNRTYGFTLDIRFKDKKARVEFSDVKEIFYNPKNIFNGTPKPTDKEDMEKFAAKSLKPIVDDLLNALQQAQVAENW